MFADRLRHTCCTLVRLLFSAILVAMALGTRTKSTETVIEKPSYEFEAPRDLLTVLPALFGFIPLLVTRGESWYFIPFIALIGFSLLWSSASQVIGSTSWYRTTLDRRIIELSRAAKTSRVLNAASGTGSLAISFVKVVRPVEVWATDTWRSTKRMVDPSRRTRDNARLEGVGDIVQVRHVDPLNLPFKSGYFNTVGTRYGISNSRKEKRKTLWEMLRVTRPGGTIVLAETLPIALWLRFVVLRRLAQEYKTGAISLSRFHFTGIVSAQKLG